MSFFRLKIQSVSSKGVSSDYITREAVQRANEMLMGRPDIQPKSVHIDVFARNNIEPPTSRQISDAGAAAMRAFRLDNR